MKIKRGQYGWHATAVAGSLLPFAAYATLPASAELQRLHDVLNTAPTPTEIPDAPAPMLPTPTPLSGPADARAAETYFTLNSLKIDGVTLYKPEDLLPLFKYATGQRISVKDLYDLANAITTTYRNDGYILARAVIPPQDITAGHVKIKVMEGTLDRVIVTGDAADSRLIRAYADKLKGAPLHNAELERYLLLMNDLPGLSATSTLRPAETPGASDLVITVKETKASGSYGISNWGTRYVGPNQLESDVTLNNMYANNFNWHDQTRLRSVQTTELRELSYLDLHHMLPLFDEGTELSVDMHRSVSHPGYTLESLDLNSETSGMSIALSHPLQRSRTQNLDWFVMFDWRDTTTNTLGDRLSLDKIRALRAGFDWDRTDSWGGISTARLELSHGLGMFDASNAGDADISRLRGTGTGYTRFQADVARLQRLNKSWNLLLAATGQYATHSLLAGEEFGVGGENYGRGYDTSEITGDSGVAAKAELQINFPVGWEYLDSWQLFGFFDAGVAWQRDHEIGEPNQPSSLTSHGFGIRSKLGETLSVDLTMAKPGTRGVNTAGGSKNPNLYVRVKNRF